MEKQERLNDISVLNFIILGGYSPEIVYSFFSSSLKGKSGMVVLPPLAGLVQVYVQNDINAVLGCYKHC